MGTASDGSNGAAHVAGRLPMPAAALLPPFVNARLLPLAAPAAVQRQQTSTCQCHDCTCHRGTACWACATAHTKKQGSPLRLQAECLAVGQRTNTSTRGSWPHPLMMASTSTWTGFWSVSRLTMSNACLTMLAAISFLPLLRPCIIRLLVSLQGKMQ